MNVKLRVLSAGVLFFIGHSAMAQKVKKDTAAAKSIDEVVITGYTTKKKENLTTSVTTVDAKQINDIPIASFDQILAGKAPGVSVGTGSGQPGTASSIVIRGVGSINGGTTPLYIVDGVPVNANVFASLNPNDFEDISILKDAAAKAVYGSQAGNGVILVKTKSGKRNGRFTVNYSGNIGASMLPEAKFNMMDTKTLLGIQKDLGFWNLNDPADSAEYNRLMGINTNWKDAFLKDGLTYQNDLSFTGGAQNTDYRFSLGYLNQEGVVKNTGLQRFTSNLSLNSGNGTNFRFGVNATFGYSKKNNINSEAGIALANPVAAAYLALPYQPLYKPDGSLDVGSGKLGANAYQLLTTQQRLMQEFKMVAGVYTDYDFTDNVTISWRGNVDHTGQFYKGYIDPTSFNGQSTNPGNSGSLSRQYNQFTGLNTNLLLKYSNSFGDHKVSGYIGGEYTGKFVDGFNVTGYGLNKFLGNVVNSVLINKDLLPSITGAERSLHILSYMASVDYSYKGKYLLSANIRRDGASFFSTSYKWGTFGGVSGAWYISKEDFLSGNSVLSDLKLRASWGKLGNTGDLFDVAAYNDKKYLNLGQYDGQYTFGPSGPLNTTYRWESESQYDIGFDFGFWKNRITGTVDYYDRLTSDLYINKSLSYSSGFSGLSSFNGGKMRNRGVEAAINVDVIRKSDLKLNVYANYAYNRNRIEDLGEVSEYVLGTSIVRVGLPFGSHYAVGWGGVDPATGAPIYLDKNNQRMTQFDGSQSQATYGSYMPPHTGGFGFNLNYKGFFVEPQFQFKTGFYRFNNMRYFNENVRNIGSYNQYDVVSTYWKTPGQVTDIQGYNYALQFTSKFIEDSSFLRLRNVRVGYTFPKQMLGDFGLSNATIYMNATNLFTWTKWTGLDPDDSNNLASYEYPSPRIVTIGVNLTF
ncbi:SusC/RagA family TonB-linked outer membrane protein [Elizabethkingia anophelis]|uniref:SusC/RagA family TonB-linked outer membrane protein n=1 Tax=Elizabethkingia anophelis TaxID=1117645 RepID=UPI00040CEC93|nr:SusC/RagA family TonB-linked outer membrane protein [Elizabethkingia anophelis]